MLLSLFDAVSFGLWPLRAGCGSSERALRFGASPGSRERLRLVFRRRETEAVSRTLAASIPALAPPPRRPHGVAPVRPSRRRTVAWPVGIPCPERLRSPPAPYDGARLTGPQCKPDRAAPVAATVLAGAAPPGQTRWSVGNLASRLKVASPPRDIGIALAGTCGTAIRGLPTRG